MNLEEKILHKCYVYSGKIINIRRDDALLPDGKTAVREVVEHNGGVCVGAVTKNAEMYFVRQFRYPYFEVLLEAPAGKLEKGEDPFEAGKRELEEETGIIANDYIDLGNFYPSPGYCGEKIHLYAAFNLKETHTNPDDDEFLEVEKLPIKNAVEMVLNGKIPDGKTQAIVLRINEMINRGDIKL